MKIGLVVTCKNAWDYTKGCLASVKSEHDVYTVVVDDGSTDNTKAGLKAWQSEDKENRWCYYDPPFSSLSEKWNIGIQRCWENGCDVAVVSNNDVLYHPATLDVIAGRLMEGEEGLVMVTAFDVSGNFEDMGNVPPHWITTGEWDLDYTPSEAEAPDFSLFAISKDCWKTVGEFDPRYVPAYFEDNDYHERIIRKGLRAITTTAAPYYHYGSVTREHDGAVTEEKHISFRSTRNEFYAKWGFIPHGNAVLPKRPKLLVIGDGDRPTGFARVVHSILERLVPYFEIHHLAINYFGDPHGKPWDMYPAHLGAPNDIFGMERLAAAYDHIKPDAVFMVQDLWHIAEYIRTNHGMRGLTCYYPIDSPNMDPSWVGWLSRCPEVCTYTQFGADVSAKAAERAFGAITDQIIQQRGPGDHILGDITFPTSKRYHDENVLMNMQRLMRLRDPGAYNVIPHGVDGDLFSPVDKKVARRVLGIPQDHFVVGYVHRNQPRKRQDLMIRAFAKFVKGCRDDGRVSLDSVSDICGTPTVIKDATLVLHSSLDAIGGWELKRLCEAYGIWNQVFLTPPTVQESFYDDEHMNYLMNSFDLNANLGGGEGWGLSHMESAMVGVPQMVPDYSATAEIWGDGGAMLVDVVEVQHTDQGLNTCQGVVGTDHAADIMLELYEDRGQLEALGEQARLVVQDPKYDWDNIAEQFREVIMRSATQKGVPQQLLKINVAANT